jgi:5'-3' exonuclease
VQIATSRVDQAGVMSAVRTLLAVDLCNVVTRAWYASSPIARLEDGRPSHAVESAIRTITRIARSEVVDDIVAASDGPDHTGYRRTIDPGYKRLRPPRPEDARRQVQLSQEVLDAAGIPVLECPGYEADDVLASLASRYPGKVVVLSGDRDLLALCDDRVSVLQLRAGRPDQRCGPEECRQVFGVPPRLVWHAKALGGDPSDGLAGVRGISQEMAGRLISHFGSLATLRQAVERYATDRTGAPPELPGRVITLLSRPGVWDDALRCWRLTKLYRDLPADGRWTAVTAAYSPQVARCLEAAGYGERLAALFNVPPRQRVPA